VKLDASGALLGALRLESGGNPILRAVLATSDGGCIVAGDVSGHGLIARFDAALRLAWQQSVGLGATSGLAAAAFAPDGSVVLAGRYGNDGWLLRLRDPSAAPAFGTTGTTLPVVETPTTTGTGTMHVASWSSTASAWTPTPTNLSSLPVRDAP
jgi:hypothetical protein